MLFTVWHGAWWGVCSIKAQEMMWISTWAPSEKGEGRSGPGFRKKKQKNLQVMLRDHAFDRLNILPPTCSSRPQKTRRRRVAAARPMQEDHCPLWSPLGLLVCMMANAEVEPAVEFTALFLCHMRNPRLTPVGNAVPLETWPAWLCR